MTAQTLAVNAQNDIYIGQDGNLAVVYDLEGTLQACAHAGKTLLGEMIFATNQGLPNFQVVWVGVPNLQQYEAALRATLLSVDGVREVVSLILEHVNNTLNYTAVIRTIYGTGSISNG